MKKVLSFIIVAVLILIVTGCGFGYEDWDGDLEGEEYYILDVVQDGSVINATVSLDETAFNDYKDSLDVDDQFVVPDEIFFWVSPTYEYNNYNYYAYEQYLYPVESAKISTGFLFDENGDASGLSQSVTIDLAKIARDYNFWWLDEWTVDGAGDDDLNGFYVFMSDGFSEYWDWSYTTFNVDGSNTEFKFERSRPTGQGYSNVFAQIDSDYQQFTLVSAGLHVDSYEVIGDEPIKVTLQLDENNSSESWDNGSSMISMTGYSNGFTLDENNWSSESTDKTKIWYLYFEAPGYGASSFIGEVYHIEADKNQDFNLQWSGSWYSSNLYYRGFPSKFMATDFDGADTYMTGVFGTNASLEIEKSTEYHYDLGYTPDNDYNNWQIGHLNDYSGLQYDSYNPDNNVLGNSYSNDVGQMYSSERYDIITFPGYDYPDGVYVSISFKYRKDMDWNWYDYIEVQYEDDYSSWSGLNTLWGPLDSYEAQTNNGWTQGIFEFYTGYTSDLQAVRLVFFSNYWDESTGILIDDFAIMELQ